MIRIAVGAVVTAPFLLGAAAGTSDGDRTAFRFEDPDIVESSGLVATDGVVVTTNDSGDSGRVFAVDPATGATVGVTSWPGDPVDVEALAPAGRGQVWVGDIGDNRRLRESVAVWRVPVARENRQVEPEVVELVYPDGPHDAEALVAHPLTGRLFVITKGIFGGAVYSAPRVLRTDRSNRLRQIAEAPALVTDATFLPGGGGVVLRTYGSAYVVDFPSWAPVSSLKLPAQDQGEGIATAGGALLLSTEGARTRVLRVPLPPEAIDLEVRSPAWTGLGILATARALPLPVGE